ncbi:MAG: hypothetical protein ACLR95_02620 [Enterococcus avium]
MLYQKPTKFTVNEIRGITYAKNLAEQFDKIVNLPKVFITFQAKMCSQPMKQPNTLVQH